MSISRRALFATLALAACGGPPDDRIAATIPAPAPPFPARRNGRHAPDRAITNERLAASHNNFYELASSKDVWRYTGAMQTDRWTLDVTGLVARPRRYGLEDLLRLEHEERVYRLRCVETWALVVPWSGFPLRKLLLEAAPTAEARFVRFVSLSEADQQPAVAARPWAGWPYTEGLRLDEAMHELTFVATGIYGHALPKQHGAPVRIVVPWKYGYKSPKSVVRIEVVAEKPTTFWEQAAPTEYPFESNVDPAQPHPRWSQAAERMLGTWDVRRTLPYNGYGSLVASLY
jgi:methionine sulfoxide reductase catalytic subunit